MNHSYGSTGPGVSHTEAQLLRDAFMDIMNIMNIMDIMDIMTAAGLCLLL